MTAYLEEGEYFGVEFILPFILFLGQKTEELLHKLSLGEVLVDDPFLRAHFVDCPSKGRLLRDWSIDIHHAGKGGNMERGDYQRGIIKVKH